MIKNQSFVNKEGIDVTPEFVSNCSTPLVESPGDTHTSTNPESANRQLSYGEDEFITISDISRSTDKSLTVNDGQKDEAISNISEPSNKPLNNVVISDENVLQRSVNHEISNDTIYPDNVKSTNDKRIDVVNVETRNSFESLARDNDDELNCTDQDVEDFYDNYHNNVSLTSKGDEFRYVNNRKTNKRSTLIISDSMTRGVRGKKLKEYIFNQNVYVKTYGGAKPGDIKYLAIPSLKYRPDHVVVHVGSNDIKTRKSADNIANSVIKVCDRMKRPENAVSVSGVIYRCNKEQNIKVDQVNYILQRLCRERGYYFLDNSNISLENLCYDGLHLNKSGDNILFNNLLTCINY